MESTFVLLTFVVALAVLTVGCVVQIFLAKKGPWLLGLILPVLYWAFSILPIVRALTVNAVQRVPNYYSAAALFFPDCLLLMIYFIFYYYWKCKKA